MAEGSDGLAPNADTDYERSDTALAPLAFVGLGLLLLLAIAPLVILAGFHSTATDVDRRPTVLPPQPRLQIHPSAELAAYLGRERALLNSYGWVDRAHGIVRIPITEAMRRAARNGIVGFPKAPPAQPDSEAEAGNRTTVN